MIKKKEHREILRSNGLQKPIFAEKPRKNGRTCIQTCRTVLRSVLLRSQGGNDVLLGSCVLLRIRAYCVQLYDAMYYSY